VAKLGMFPCSFSDRSFLQPRKCNICRLQKRCSAERSRSRSRRRMVGGVSSVKRVWKSGGEGEQAEVNFGDGLDRPVPRQRTGPTLVRAAQSELGDFLQPTKLSRLTYKATRQGWRSCLVLMGAKSGTLIRPSLFWAHLLLTSTIPNAFTRRRNEIGSSIFA
jgi:hypothetical protein